jgi:uncharacterized membrane protein YdbT with pleckstrin-like domain
MTEISEVALNSTDPFDKHTPTRATIQKTRWSTRNMVSAWMGWGFTNLILICLVLKTPTLMESRSVATAAIVFVVSTGIVLLLVACIRKRSYFKLQDGCLTFRNHWFGNSVCQIDLAEVGAILVQQGMLQRRLGVGQVQLVARDGEKETAKKWVLPGIARVELVAEILERARRTEIEKYG